MVCPPVFDGLLYQASAGNKTTYSLALYLVGESKF